MKTKLVPTSFLSLHRVVASEHGLRALRRSLMTLNVLPRKHRRSHAEQNQCRFRDRHNISLPCVDCFPRNPCALIDV